MFIPTTTINGKTYELSTKLIVAYKLQGANNHKPYLEIFKEIDKMPVEKQIELLYLAFEAQNPDAAKEIEKKDFTDYYLYNYDLREMMAQLEGVIHGITGDDGSEAPAGTEGTSGN